MSSQFPARDPAIMFTRLKVEQPTVGKTYYKDEAGEVQKKTEGRLFAGQAFTETAVDLEEFSAL